MASERYPHIVVLEVIRRLPAERPSPAIPTWPYLDRGEADGADPEEPALHAVLGYQGPFGE